jgi:hypothetical protein
MSDNSNAYYCCNGHGPNPKALHLFCPECGHAHCSDCRNVDIPARPPKTDSSDRYSAPVSSVKYHSNTAASSPISSWSHSVGPAPTGFDKYLTAPVSTGFHSYSTIPSSVGFDYTERSSSTRYNVSSRISTYYDLSNRSSPWSDRSGGIYMNSPRCIGLGSGEFKQATSVWHCCACGDPNGLSEVTLSCLCGHQHCSNCPTEQVKDVSTVYLLALQQMFNNQQRYEPLENDFFYSV